MVRSQIEADPPQISVEDVTLTLSGFTGESGTQMGLLKDVHEGRRRLEEVERQLRERMNGEHALYRIAEVAPWHPAPDMRALQVPIDPSGADAIKPLHSPRPVEVREGDGTRAGVGVLGATVAAGGADIRYVDVRPVVAP